MEEVCNKIKLVTIIGEDKPSWGKLNSIHEPPCLYSIKSQTKTKEKKMSKEFKKQERFIELVKKKGKHPLLLGWKDLERRRK